MNALAADLSHYYAQQDALSIKELILEPMIEDEREYLTQDAYTFSTITEELIEEPGWPIEAFLLSLMSNRNDRMRQLELVDHMLGVLDRHLSTVACNRAAVKYAEAHL